MQDRENLFGHKIGAFWDKVKTIDVVRSSSGDASGIT
jgi:hypothetical protein